MPDTSASGLVRVTAATSDFGLYVITDFSAGGASRRMRYQDFMLSYGVAFTTADETKLDAITSSANVGFVTISADSGGVSATSAAAVFSIVGGNGISTSATGSTLTIVGNSTNAFGIVSADSGGVSASSTQGTFSIVGGNGITTSATGSTITIVGNSANAFGIVSADSGGVSASANSGTFTIAGGTFIQTSGASSTITIENTMVVTSATSPTSANDVTGGYQVGQVWINTSADTAFILVSDGTASADWNQIDSVGGGASANAFGIVSADTGGISASSPTATFSIVGGTGISTSATGSTITITNTGTGSVGVVTSATAPTSSDDISAGHTIGDLWVNTSSDRSWIMVSQGTASAVWNELPPGGGATNEVLYTSAGVLEWGGTLYTAGEQTKLGGIRAGVNVLVTTSATAPTSADDVSAGFEVGDLWVNTSSDNAYILVANGTASAVWNQIDAGGTSTNAFGIVSADAGGVSASATQGVFTIAGGTFVETSGTGSTITIENTMVVTSATSPTSANDVTGGYQVGQVWINTSSDTAFILVSDGTASADWNQIDSVGAGQNAFVTVSASAGHVSATSANGVFSIVGGTGISTSATGSTITVENTAFKFLRVSASVGHVSASAVNGSFQILGGPGITTSAAGNSVFVQWANVTGPLIIGRVTGTGVPQGLSAAAVRSILRVTSATDPTSADDITLNNNLGTLWINTSSDQAFINVSDGTASALWDQISNQNAYTIVSADTGGVSASSQTGSFIIAGGTGIATSATGSTITVVGLSASTGGQGVIEVATTAEVSAGTDAQRAITPAAFAGSRYDPLGTHSIWVPAAAMTPTTTGGAAALALTQLSASTPEVQGFAFDPSQDEAVQFTVAFPNSWNLGQVTYQAFWTHVSASTDGVAWAMQAQSRATGEAIEASYSASAIVVQDDLTGTNFALQVTTTSSGVDVAGTPANGELVWFRFFRDVSDTNDDSTQDAILIGVKVNYVTDQATDG